MPYWLTLCVVAILAGLVGSYLTDRNWRKDIKEAASNFSIPSGVYDALHKETIVPGVFAIDASEVYTAACWRDDKDWWKGRCQDALLKVEDLEEDNAQLVKDLDAFMKKSEAKRIPPAGKKK